MVARIKSGRGLKQRILYNEAKVEMGTAELISGGNMVLEAATMTVAQKLRSFERLTTLAPDVGSNAVHIFLSFAPGEQLEREQLAEIAREYMSGVRLGGQPYLCYRHYDTATPHVHLVTTNVAASGQRIDLNNVGRRESRAMCKALEARYGLVRAEKVTKTERTRLRLDGGRIPERPAYGQAPTKDVMEKALAYVLDAYRIGSLAELNVALAPFHLALFADRGRRGGQERGGILCSFIDERGNRRGVPLKASMLTARPTLSRLVTVFESGKAAKETMRAPLGARIETVLDRFLGVTAERLTADLAAVSVELHYRRDAAGKLIGVTYHDRAQQTVCNGGELGKGCSRHRLQALLSTQTLEAPELERHLNALDRMATTLTGPEGDVGYLGAVKASMLEAALIGKGEDAPGEETARRLVNAYMSLRRDSWRKADSLRLDATLKRVLDMGRAPTAELLGARLAHAGIAFKPIKGGVRFEPEGCRGLYRLYFPAAPVKEALTPLGVPLAARLDADLSKHAPDFVPGAGNLPWAPEIYAGSGRRMRKKRRKKYTAKIRYHLSRRLYLSIKFVSIISMATFVDFVPYVQELRRRKEFIQAQLQQFETAGIGSDLVIERIAYLKGEAEGVSQCERIVTDAMVLLFHGTAAGSLVQERATDDLSELFPRQAFPLHEVLFQLDDIKNLN